MPDTLKSNVRLLSPEHRKHDIIDRQTIGRATQELKKHIYEQRGLHKNLDPISELTDCHTLQSDLHRLEKWEVEWLMSFNPDKCEIIHISSQIGIGP
jgi:hypothetical protein